MNSTLGPRDLGGIFNETYRIYVRNFWRLMAIVAIVEVIVYILTWVWILPVAMTAVWAGPFIWTESLAPFIVAVVIIVVVSVVVAILAYALMGGALIHAISEQSLGRTISIGRAYRFALRRLVTMILVQILVLLACSIMIMTIVGIPFAIYFGISWIFIVQVALLEGVGPTAALSRSSDLVKGNWWRVLGSTLVVVITVGAIGSILSLILGLIPIIGEIIASILITPIAIIAATLLYYDLRVRKEGYSLEVMAQELAIADEPRASVQ